MFDNIITAILGIVCFILGLFSYSMINKAHRKKLERFLLTNLGSLLLGVGSILIAAWGGKVWESFTRLAPIVIPSCILASILVYVVITSKTSDELEEMEGYSLVTLFEDFKNMFSKK